MKKLIIFLFFLTSSDIYASDINLEKIVDGLKKPWSLSFVDQHNIVFTEKTNEMRYPIDYPYIENEKLLNTFFKLLQMNCDINDVRLLHDSVSFYLENFPEQDPDKIQEKIKHLHRNACSRSLG